MHFKVIWLSWARMTNVQVCLGMRGSSRRGGTSGAQSGSVVASLEELVTPRVGHRRQRVRCNNSGDRRYWVEDGEEAATSGVSPGPTLQNSLFSLSPWSLARGEVAFAWAE